VQQAFQNHGWTADIQGVVTIEIIVEYIQLWELLLDIQLQPKVEDTHFWRLSANGKYSAKSRYDHLFMGATLFKPCERIWKSWAPPNCQFFLWLVAHLSAVGLHIAWHAGVCPIWINVRFAIKRMKILIIF
jgi:hypothetical protein